MKYHLKIGGIGIRILSKEELRIEESMIPFMSDNILNPDVEVETVWRDDAIPVPQSSMSGEDVLSEYYLEKDKYYCMTKGGWKGYLGSTICDKSFSRMTCYINKKDFQMPVESIGNLLRFLPMRMILQKHQILFLHASQIVVKNKGILFTAPSGTGKTTQAKLWMKCRQAEIICNDRVLVREGLTYGYPIDGSEPVMSGKVNSLGAVVLLKQGMRNEIQQLKPTAAMAQLMPQVVFDTWNLKSRELAMQQLLELIKKYPVYLLKCTPDEEAVFCLEGHLIKEGILT